MRTYAKPGVAEACLALQNRHGLDVNMLLFAVWAGNEGCILSEAAIGDAIERVRRWHTDIVKPLRTLRRRLKDDPHGADPALAEALRGRVAAVELAAEHVEQLVLNDLMRAQESSPPVAAIHGNSATYASVASIVWSEEDQRDLAAIVAATLLP